MNSPDLDIDDRIESTGCKMQYDLLQECIDLHNRDWRKCQLELKQLSKCLYDKKST